MAEWWPTRGFDRSRILYPYWAVSHFIKWHLFSRTSVNRLPFPRLVNGRPLQVQLSWPFLLRYCRMLMNASWKCPSSCRWKKRPESFRLTRYSARALPTSLISKRRRPSLQDLLCMELPSIGNFTSTDLLLLSWIVPYGLKPTWNRISAYNRNRASYFIWQLSLRSVSP
jgi:hypothetical protein